MFLSICIDLQPCHSVSEVPLETANVFSDLYPSPSYVKILNLDLSKSFVNVIFTKPFCMMVDDGELFGDSKPHLNLLISLTSSVKTLQQFL